MERPITQPGRAVGNTTRLIDYYIQELFNGGTIVVVDHFIGDNKVDSDGGRRASMYLYVRIQRRLSLEHQNISKRLIYNDKKLEIRLENVPALCPDTCIYLRLNEDERNQQVKKVAHRCNKYDQLLKHGKWHPRLIKVAACV